MEPDSFPEKYRQDLAIVRETAEQVLKDFGIFGIEITFSGNAFTAYDELEMQIRPVLFELFQKDKSRFQALLYRIDISEPAFRKLIGTGGNDDFPGRIAAAILQREFQKVITRKYYSERNNPGPAGV